MDSPTAPKPRVRPAGLWYLLVPVCIAVGVFIGVSRGIDEGRRIVDSFHQLGPDGRGSTTLDAGEQASVWAVYEDSSSSPTTRPTATVRVTGPDGELVDSDLSPGSSTFSVNGDSGVRVATFRAPQDGRYDVSVAFQLPSGASQRPVAAVGSLDVTGAIGRSLRPVGLGLLAAIALTIFLAVSRGRAKRRIRQQGWSPIASPGVPGYEPPASRSAARPSPQPGPSVEPPSNSGPFL